MAKKIIRLTEGELKEVVTQCVNKVLLWNENNEDYIHRQMVDETLIYSYEANMVIRHLCNTFYLAKGLREYNRNPNNYQGYVEKRKNKNNCSVILLSLPTNNIALLREITLSMEKACGWFLACQIQSVVQGHEAWQYEKKKDNDATADVVSRQFVYHLCPTSRLQKILHVGLLPKKTTWSAFMLNDEHTFRDRLGQHYGWMTVDRVYVFMDKPSKVFLGHNTFQQKNIVTSTYTLLQIDTNKLLPNTKFSYDPRSTGAAYTMNNIPPSAISVVK